MAGFLRSDLSDLTRTTLRSAARTSPDRSYLTRVCFTDTGQENERRTLRISSRHDRLPRFTTANVESHGMPQEPACFASEEDVSEMEGAHTEPSRRVRKSEATSLMHLRKLGAALRRVNSHIRATAVEQFCISHLPALLENAYTPYPLWAVLGH